MHSLDGNNFGSYLGVNCNLDSDYWSYAEVNSDMAGGPDDNEDTAFDKGGQGSCASQGLPTYAVNTAFMTLVAEDTDFAYQSFGQRVATTRTWNMPPTSGGMFGNGWSFAYASTLHATDYTAGTATVTLGNGQTLLYNVTGTQGHGTGTVTVSYACPSKGRRPVLTGYVSENPVAASYVLYDKGRRLSSRYEFARQDVVHGGNIYRLVSVTDDNGNALAVGYDESGRLVSLTDASGRATTFTYTVEGRVATMLTFAGTSAAYTYDAAGNLKTATDLDGNVSTFAYDAETYLTAMTTAGKSTSFAYAAVAHRKRLSRVTDPLGKVRTYDLVSGETRITDPGGEVRAFASTRGRTNMIKNPLGQTTSVSYNDSGLPTRVTSPDGATEHFEYDGSGNLVRYEDAEHAVSTMTYNAAGDMLTLTDPLGNVWTRLYDDKRNLTRLTTPLGRQTALAYDAKGQLTTLTAPGGAVTTFAYDARGDLTRIGQPTGEDLVFAYDAHGLEMVSSTDGRGGATTFDYDANRRQTRMTLPGGGHYDYAYDCCALSSLTDPGGAVMTLERDALLRITRIVDPAARATALAYDVDGQLASRTDPMSRTTRFASDEAGRITRVTSPLGGHVDYGRDDRGLVASLTDQRGKTTTISYDNRGLLSSQTDPSNQQAFSLTRDGLGRVTARTNARGGHVGYAHDADGRISTKTHDGTTVADYVWDTPGFLASTTDPSGNSGALEFTRDAMGRATTVTYPDGLTLNLTYDAVGNVATMTYPGGMVVTYVYDALNRPTRVSFDGKIIDMAYDASGRLTTETRSTGVTSSYAFDSAGRLARIRHFTAASTIVDLTQTRDAAGQITAESGTLPVGPTLTTKQVTGSYDDADNLVTFGSDTFTSDQDGNVTAVSGSRSMALAYDNENRMTSLSSAGAVTTYLYNGLGDRVRSTKTGGATRNFRHDPFGRLAFETNASGTVTSLYIWVGARIAAYGTTSEGFVWPLYDRVGSTLALTDGTGATIGAYAYAPYGARAGKTGTAASFFTYVGAFGVMDEGGGVYFMKNRYYDATTGRFLQRDPVGFLGGDNLYRYLRNNPVSRIDPMGFTDFEMDHSGWYDVNTAEGTYDLATGRAPHMAEPASDAEILIAGAVIATTVTAMVALPILCAAPAAGGAITAGGAISSEAAIADSIVNSAGVVETLVQQAMRGANYRQYLVQLSRQGKEGEVMLQAISRYAGKLLPMATGKEKNIIHTIFDTAQKGWMLKKF